MTQKAQEDPYMDLLWDWWFTSTNILVDAVGYDGALKVLRPYYKNANVAASKFMMDQFSEVEQGPDIYIQNTLFASKVWLGTETTIRIFEDRIEYRSKGCKTGGKCRAVCQLTSRELLENIGVTTPVTSSGMYGIKKSLCNGDDHCQVVLGKLKFEPYKINGPYNELSTPDYPKELIDFYQPQYLGESWVFTIRAFLDCFDSETTCQMLCKSMRLSGMTYGIEKIRSKGQDTEDILLLADIIEDVCHHHKRKVEHSQSGDVIEMEFTECPFSQSPPEVCRQYEAFFKGICEAVNPELDFIYDRMVTLGDGSCHCHIARKKGSGRPSEGKADEGQEMLRALKWRLAKGEISLEEFQRMKRELLD